MVSIEVLGLFVMLHVGNVLWFELMRGGVGMPQLKVHDKQGIEADVKQRVRTDKPSKTGHQICTVRVIKGHILIEIGRPCIVARSAKTLVMWS
jgi:hypothetical protein